MSRGSSTLSEFEESPFSLTNLSLSPEVVEDTQPPLLSGQWEAAQDCDSYNVTVYPKDLLDHLGTSETIISLCCQAPQPLVR